MSDTAEDLMDGMGGRWMGLAIVKVDIQAEGMHQHTESLAIEGGAY